MQWKEKEQARKNISNHYIMRSPRPSQWTDNSCSSSLRGWGRVTGAHGRAQYRLLILVKEWTNQWWNPHPRQWVRLPLNWAEIECLGRGRKWFHFCCFLRGHCRTSELIWKMGLELFTPSIPASSLPRDVSWMNQSIGILAQPLFWQ